MDTKPGMVVALREPIEITVRTEGVGEKLFIVLPICTKGQVLKTVENGGIQVQFLTHTIGGFFRLRLVKTLYKNDYAIISSADTESEDL